MKNVELADELAGLNLEIACISDLLFIIASKTEDTVSEKDKLLYTSIYSVSSHLEHISNKIGQLFLQA